MTAADIADLEERLMDPVWRLTSGELYKIKTADGRGIIPFVPREEQRTLLLKLLAALEGRQPGEERPSQFVELKARRLGYSTAIGVFIADSLGFRESFTATLIDQTGDDAKKKMNDIVKVAVASIREMFPLRLIKDNDSELSLTTADDKEGKSVSTFYAGTKARGGSNDFLWASELGVIQFDDPPRADEIITGAFPSARHGIKVVETTWKGGKGGKLFEIISPTLNGTADDWRVSFSPWYLDPRNASTVAALDVESNAYFAKIAERLEKDGIALTEEQRRWWAAERRTLGIFMARENPTFIDECWTVPVPGAIFAEDVARAEGEGRIANVPYYEGALVNTSWDLGAPVNMAVWYWQITGMTIRIIDYDHGDFGTHSKRVAHMLSKGYNYGKHYLPHDAQTTERTGSNFSTDLINAGLPSSSIVTVPRCYSVWIGINHLKEMFANLSFDAKKCEVGLNALRAYRKKTEGEGALSTTEPVHDWASHPSDALRMMAEAHNSGLVAFKYTEAKPQPDYYGHRPRRRAAVAMRVSANA
jgi:hypothetical protein